jgi:fibronectin type 3 domain-containing protein
MHGIGTTHSGTAKKSTRYRQLVAVLVAGLAFTFVQLTFGLASVAAAATPLNVFVGYMDTHSTPASSKQPTPWPYTDPASYLGSPCPNFPNDTTCWDAAALRLDNPGSVDVTGVHPVVNVGGSTYDLWGSTVTVKAHGTLVLTETGSQNSTNFDASDFSPNAYNGGNVASCVNSGAIPQVQISIAGSTTTYLDSGQVLNGGGVDSGHCLNGSFVSGRMDESHPWVQIGSSAPSVPSAPQSLAATAGSGSVSLSWRTPTSDGGAAISGYNVYRGTSSGAESTTPVAPNVSGTAFTDTGLTNGTTYFYTVAAVNSAGPSAQSNEVSATPKLVQANPPTAPQALTAVAGNGTATLSWNTPTSDGGSPITGYSVYRGATAGGEGAAPIATNISTRSFSDTGLTNGSTYFYKVAAVNAIGTSPPSNEATAAPQPTAPSAPTGLVASGGSGSVTLSWTAPVSDGGAAITGYNIYRGTAAAGEASTPVATGVALTTFTDAGRTNGTAYFYKVAAVNSAGTSGLSNEASATPQQAATAPLAPQNLTAATANAAVQLTWTAPSSNGGAAITGYNVYRGTSSGAESVAPVASNVSGTSFTDTGLTNGTAYFYKVAAVNAVGVSLLSNEASAIPRATVPTAPLAATATAGNASVTVAWSIPASNGGAAITGYNVYRGTAAGGEASTPVASNVSGASVTDSGLVNGTAYFYQVAAVNSVGVSARSNEASASPQAPAAVAYVRRVGSATASTSRATTTLTVGAPGVSAGHALVVNALLSSTSITGSVGVQDSAGNSYLIGRDVNDGSSGDRTVVFVATNVKALAAGTSITLSYPSAGETHLAVDEYSGVTGIDTSAGASASGTAFSSGVAPPTTQATDLLVGAVGAESGTTPSWSAGWTGLPALAISSDYLGAGYRVATAVGSYAASGNVGGQWMAAIVTLKTAGQSPPPPPPPTPTAPSSPQGLTATAGNGSVQLSWAAPASDGGAAISGYNIYRGAIAGGEGATPIATNVATTSFTDATVVNATAYFYKVGAVNSVGVSPLSIEASATPQATTTAPSAPQGLNATAGNSSAQLSWTAPTSTGGAPITGYNVYRGASSGAESATPIASNVNATSFTDSAVLNGNTYFYQVAAVNSVGTSARSGETSATPQAAVGAGYVRRVGSGTASASRTTTSIVVGAPGVAAGHTLVVALLLSSTAPISGAVSGKDTAGNSYIIARDVNDGSAGDRSLVLVSVNVKAVLAGGAITLTYPSSGETHLSVDEFAGVTGTDVSAGASATGTAFSSGATANTVQATEILVGAVGAESGSAPTWSTGWTALPTLAISSDYLSAAYRIVSSTGSYAATGSIGGQWMAGIVTLKTS